LVSLVVLLCVAVVSGESMERATAGMGMGAGGALTRASRVRPEKRLTGAASTLTKSNAFCVVCQFAVQRVHADLVQLAPGVYLQSGEAASLPPVSPVAVPPPASAFLEMETEMETEAEAESESELESAAERRRPSFNTFEHGGLIAPRRYRGADILGSRPARVRFNHLNTPSPDPNREAARAAYRKLYQSVYASFEALCTRRMPFAYLPYCKTMLKSYRYIAQGIHYGDRPEQICINGGFCDKRSYVRQTVHTLYKPEKGDAYSRGK